MSFTDEELEILDTLICGVDVNEEVFETFTNKLLESVNNDANDICDVNEDAFEEFMNDMCVFAIQYSEREQNCIADHIRELFTDKCFVYLVHRYATGKNNIEMFSKEFFKLAVKEKDHIDDPELEDSKHINEEFRRFIWDFLYNSKVFKGCE